MMLSDSYAFQDVYKFHRLIFVNSAAYAYTVIRVDKHTALCGQNNLGKTSMLNALKLFLLPHENFKSCNKKFAFKGPAGTYYSTDASYSYYFPENHSFIILEAENMHGPFCLVLHRGNRPFSYGRMAVPCKYADIQHMFWDLESPINGGMGAPIEGISLSGVLSDLRARGGEAMNDSAIIRQRLFGEQALNREEGRFCLLPLRNGGTAREIDAWKMLIHLAFDIGAKDNRTLPDTIATIIEGDKDRKNAELSVSLSEILDDYENLKKEGDRLADIESARRSWEGFDSQFQLFETKSELIVQSIVDVEHALAERQSSILDDVKAASERYQALDVAHSAKRQHHGLVKAEYLKLAGALSLRHKDLDGVQKQLFRVSEILRRYPGTTEHEVRELLSDLSAELTAEIETLTNKVQSAEQLAQAIRNKNSLSHQRDQLRKILDEHVETVLEQVDRHSASVLSSLNSTLFTKLTPRLNSDQKQAIKEFGCLFQERGSFISFLSQETSFGFMSFDPTRARKQHEQDLIKLDDDIKDCDDLIRRLNDDSKLTAEQAKDKAKKLTRERIETDEEVQLLSRHGYMREQQKALELEVGEQTVELAKLHESVADAAGELEDLAVQVEHAKEVLGRVRKENEDLRNYLEQIRNVAEITLGFLSIREMKLKARDTFFHPSQIKEISQFASEVAKSREALQVALDELLKRNLLGEEGRDFGYHAFHDLSRMRSCRRAFAAMFGTLEGEQQTYQAKVTAHNSNTSIQIDEIKHARRMIKEFEKEVDDQLSEFSVSDLEAIEIYCVLNPHFEELLVDIDSINLMTTGLHEKRLYERLRAFCTEFFVNGGRRGTTLDMSLLIDRVGYRYRKRGHDKYTEEDQSNGTTAMINCRLLSILLRRLLVANTQICLPLVMDELSNLSHLNLKAARGIAESEGFVLFGATPEPTSTIAKVIENYIDLSHFLATDRAYSHLRRVIYTGESESLRTKKDPADAVAEITAG
ncbi:hypothetical protein [Pseudomonas syringae group sp. J309-1]|uniref:hypothetical protein n=1 Tax=Pseudomonas syringae group sp. J309-1 TaxID=3079588 RepID=UPI002911949B|nr:hypothetical protein [Pseudomonas syringae group sp. J309-1]MDU8357943.1 hypothetical protein [Pseudomonas syringae group sp. J309-1]